jgi:Ca2+/Na+ antiporter
MMSTAFNSNAINAIVGLMLPGALLGLGAPTQDAAFVAIFYVGLTALAVALALRGKGLDRRVGSIIIVAYLVFVAILATR